MNSLKETGRNKTTTASVVTGAEGLTVQVYVADVSRPAAGLDWKLSPETEQAMSDIDANIRAAEMKSGSLLVG